MYEVEELEEQVSDLEAQMLRLNAAIDKALKETAAEPKSEEKDNVEDFENVVTAIRKRDNCSRQAAMSTARRENPSAFAAYQDGPDAGKGFDELVEAEIRKGVPETVAAQRVGARHPEMIATIEKKQTPFEDLVDAIVEHDGVSRSVAMSRARKQEPVKFLHYQNQQEG